MDIVDIPVVLPEKPVRLLDQLRHFIRSRGMAYKTEQTYVRWTLRFIRFHKKRHPKEMGSREVEAFLSHLAINRNCAVNTQKTALNALVFLYREFLQQPLENLEVIKAKRRQNIPEIFSHKEAIQVIDFLQPPYNLMANMMYGSGLRISESIRLRVQDINFSMGYILVRNGKGGKDRRTLLPESCLEPLQKQIIYVENLLKLDRDNGIGGVYMPGALQRKFPKASTELGWQFLFPSANPSTDPRSGIERRHHIMDRTLQRRVRTAVKQAGIVRRCSSHTFRHSFATRLLENGYDIRTIQELMGHSSVETTEIYTHVLRKGVRGVKSPIDG